MYRTYDMINVMTTKDNNKNCTICSNVLTGTQRKYCSKKCSQIATMEDYKDVYKDLNWVGGPRGRATKSSIKKEEVMVFGQGHAVLGDYSVDQNILAIAETNHDLNMEARGDYEQKVVVDGLEQFVKSYNENHETSYGSYAIEANNKKKELDVYFTKTKGKHDKSH